MKAGPSRRRPSRRSALKALAALGAAEIVLAIPARTTGSAPREDPVAALARRYVALHREAERCSRTWREAAMRDPCRIVEAGELGLAVASARNDAAWDAVDAIDVTAFWTATPRTLACAIALLKVVQCAGGACGCHPDDRADRQRALGHVIAFLENHAEALETGQVR
jgi:hypothetical protein